MKIIASITGAYYFGLQTLTEQVLKNSKRQNISIDTIKSLVASARKENLATSVDLIFGLPGETIETFLKTISQIVSLGIGQSSVYNLKLLPGSEISDNQREKYQYKTKFRPINNRYGEYNLISGKKPIPIIETEEIAYESSSYDKNDFMLLRKHGFLFELLVSFNSFVDTLVFLSSRGINISKLFKFILQKSSEYPRLSKLFKEYEKYSENELFESEEELISSILGDSKEWNDLLVHKGMYFKINLGFVGYCMFENNAILKDISSILISYAKEKISPDEFENLYAIIKYDKSHWIVSDTKEEKLKKFNIKKEITVAEQFDYAKWTRNDYKGRLSDYKYQMPVQYTYYVDKYKDLAKIVEELDSFSGLNFYEKLLVRMSRVDLTRRRM